jgi:hypothetical protein
MGIFGYIQEKKQEFRKKQKKKFLQMNVDAEKKARELEFDALAQSKLQERLKRQLDAKNTIATSKQFKRENSFAGQIGKKIKANLEKRSKEPNMFQQAVIRDSNRPNPIFGGSSSGSNMFTSSGPSKPNPIFSSTGGSNPFSISNLKSSGKKKRKSITINIR